MEPRFTITTSYSEEEFVRYNRAVLYNVWHYKRLIIMTNIALLVIIATAVFTGDRIFAFSMLAGAAILNWYFFIGVDKKAAKAFRKNKLINGQVFDLAFFDDHYEGASELGTSVLPYTKLNRIIETPTNFYIMNQPTVGTIINKTDTPEGFIDFIHDIKANYNL